MIFYIFFSLILFPACAYSTNVSLPEKPNPTVQIVLTQFNDVPSISLPSGKNLQMVPNQGEEFYLSSGKQIDFVGNQRGIRLLYQTQEKPVEKIFAGSRLKILPQGETPIAVGKLKYRGVLIIQKKANGRLQAINELQLEDYLRGVVPAEMPAYFPPEALAAQAVAARTYAIAEFSLNGNKLYDSEMSQVYRGTLQENANTDLAIARTLGLVLTFHDEVFPAYFHSTCGGHTGDPQPILGKKSYPPLQGSNCGFCSQENSKYFDWQAHIDLAPLNRIAQQQELGNRLIALGPGNRDPWGRWTEVRLVGDQKEGVMRGDLFRMALNANASSANNLRSLMITEYTARDGGFYFRGNGWGHGVGMCQIGAMQMAKEGKNFREILAQYYPQATLAALYQ